MLDTDVPPSQLASLFKMDLRKCYNDRGDK